MDRKNPIFSGSQSYPHVEISDSEQPSVESKIESSESDDGVKDLNNENDSEFTTCVDANDIKNWVPKCDEKLKPYTNQYFTTLEDAYVFYWKYGQICNFDVRKSTKKSNAKGMLSAKYIQCNMGGSPIRADPNVWMKMVLRELKGKLHLADAIVKQGLL